MANFNYYIFIVIQINTFPSKYHCTIIYFVFSNLQIIKRSVNYYFKNNLIFIIVIFFALFYSET